MKKHILAWLLLLLLPIAVYGQANATGASATLQSAVVANGNGSTLSTERWNAVRVRVTIAGTATVNFEVQTDGTNWDAVAGYNINAPTTAVTTATATGSFIIPTGGAPFRARVSGWSSGAVTVTARQIYNTSAKLSGGGSSGLTIGTTTITSGTNTRMLFNDSGVVGEDAGFTYVKGTDTGTIGNLVVSTAFTNTALTSGRIPIAGTAGLLGDDADLTFTGGNTLTVANVAVTTLLTATSPRITTSILDANGNSMLAFTPTASAVDGFTFTNAATANPATVSIAATGSDSNINLELVSKGTGNIRIPFGTAANPALTFTTTTDRGIFGANGGMWVSIGGVAISGSDSTGFLVKSSMPMGFSAGSPGTNGLDSAFSRILAGLIGVGTGAAGSFAGGIKLSNITFTNLADSITAPTVSGFGTDPSVVANNGTIAFTINVGTGGSASTGTIVLPAATTGWVCSLYDVTTPASFVTHQTGGTTTTVTVTNYSRTTGLEIAWTASDILRCSCRAY